MRIRRVTSMPLTRGSTELITATSGLASMAFEIASLIGDLCDHFEIRFSFQDCSKPRPDYLAFVSNEEAGHYVTTFTHRHREYP